MFGPQCVKTSLKSCSWSLSALSCVLLWVTTVRVTPFGGLKFNWSLFLRSELTMVQIMAWRRPGDKSLSGPMMVSLLTHICLTRPQWVKGSHETMVFCMLCYIQAIAAVKPRSRDGFVNRPTNQQLVQQLVQANNKWKIKPSHYFAFDRWIFLTKGQ